MTDDELRRIAEIAEEMRLQKLRDTAQAISAARDANPAVVDYELPMHELVPEKEWIFDGHAHTHHPGPGEQHFFGDDHPVFNKPRDRNNKTGEPRKLLRIHGVVDYKGHRRAHYTFVWKFGHMTDCFHAYPKFFPDGKTVCWTEDEAKSFHGERVTHHGWTAHPETHAQHTARMREMVKVEMEAGKKRAGIH